MTSLWWPGDHRAGELMADEALLDAMLTVEAAWSRVLVAAGIAPASAGFAVSGLHLDREAIAVEAEADGNPVLALTRALRGHLNDSAARWLHRGLTSQDVVDTAIILCSRDAVLRLRADLDGVVDELTRLVRTYRSAPMVGRTLTQPAVPTTFGAKAAAWLRGVLDARDELARLSFPVQLGGAAGTLSGLVELGGLQLARQARVSFGPGLGLEVAAAPWHTERAAITKIGDAATTVSGAYGRIANDILVLGRPETGELIEAAGGGSSTMPGKANPVLSILVRRHALAAPQLATTLHLSLATQVDERAEGAWHVEWGTLSMLLRHSVVAGSQMNSLLSGLHVNSTAMASRVNEFADVLRAEQRSLAVVADHAPHQEYGGLVDDLINQTLKRADRSRPEGLP